MARKEQKIFHIDGAIAKDFKTKCEQMEVPASHVVEQLIKDWLAGVQVKELDSLFAPYIEKAIEGSVQKVGDRLMGPMHNIQVDVMAMLIGLGILRDAIATDMETVIDNTFDNRFLIPTRREQALSKKDRSEQNENVIYLLQRRSNEAIKKRYREQRAEKEAKKEAKSKKEAGSKKEAKSKKEAGSKK